MVFEAGRAIERLVRVPPAASRTSQKNGGFTMTASRNGGAGNGRAAAAAASSSASSKIASNEDLPSVMCITVVRKTLGFNELPYNAANGCKNDLLLLQTCKCNDEGHS